MTGGERPRGEASRGDMRLVEVDAGAFEDPRLAALVAPSLGRPEEAAEYLRRAAMRGSSLFIAMKGEVAVGEALLAPSAGNPHSPRRLESLAVRGELRGRGIGRFLIRELRGRLGGAALEAETDGSAVGFYRALGFRVSCLGEKHPGVLRYACLLEPGAPVLPDGREAGPRPGPTSVSAELLRDHGRLLVEGEISLPDASWRPLRLWIDTGSAELLVERRLAAELGSSLRGGGGGPAFRLRIGGFELDLTGVTSVRDEAPPWIFAATGAEATIPATVLMRYRACFDLPASRLGLGPSDPAAAAGLPLVCAVSETSGVAALDASMGGDELSLALDLGASFTFLDADAIAGVIARHPEWPRLEGSAGQANMWGWFFPREESWSLLRADALLVGSGEGATLVEEPAFVALPAASVGGLGAWYSRKTALPVQGFLGANTFSELVLTIDWPTGRASLERRAAAEPPADSERRDLDCVGLAFRPEEDGGWSVVAVARREGRPLVEGLAPGDRLLAVDGRPLAGLTMGEAASLLAGRPGERRRILAERSGRRFLLSARVERLP